MEQFLAYVAVENVAYHFDILYGYKIPHELQNDVKPGVRVQVPFGKGRSQRQGIVFEISKHEDDPRYKSLSKVLDKEQIMSEEMIAIAYFLKERTFCTYFEAAKVQLPTGFNLKMNVTYAAVNADESPKLTAAQKQVYDYMLEKVIYMTKDEILPACGLDKTCDALEKLVSKGLVVKNYNAVGKVGNLSVKTAALNVDEDKIDEISSALTPKQASVLSVLKDVGSASIKEICYFTGVSPAVVSALEKKDIIKITNCDVFRIPQVNYKSNNLKDEIKLTAAQQKAYENLFEKYKNGGGVSLLYGITGSGKTSVFIKLIDSVLESGRQVIVMVPEISLTPQMMAIFKGRYGDEVAIFHSALSVGERKDEYRRVREGKANIVVGTRSAVFAPFDNLGLIVIDEEQEHTYKSEASPRYHARDVAKFRTAYHKGLLLLASATPSIETYSLAKRGVYSLETLTERYGNAVLPDVTVVDLKNDRQRGNKYSISLVLQEMIEKNLEQKKQTILLMNRRGYNTFAACESCGNVITCPSCSISLTFHRANDRLMCHYCGYSTPFVTKCPHCGKNRIRYAGYGTQRIEEELKTLFPSAKVLRMDADSSVSRQVFEQKLSDFAKGEYDIMLGTQMVAKGLDFENVTLVGVVSADIQLNDDDFRSEEQTFDLLTQVVGRSGRGNEKGFAVIQTLNPENNVIRLAQDQDYDTFFDEEIKIRKALIYPPFCDICTVTTVSENEMKAHSAAKTFLERIMKLVDSEYKNLKIIILEPMPPRISKVNNKFRYRIIIKCKNSKDFRTLISRLLIEFGKCKSFSDVTFFADINPANLS
ncbi:MAG: primosomal protein N' [Acutalibacteraceae bacterium]